ncbi:MAG: hypothetical protein LKF93_09650 [Bifidobacterium tibiigranuli]|jgi:hypothetical protein|nr:hypothetical protein [Bifidobacterium tibiigranuli]
MTNVFANKGMQSIPESVLDAVGRGCWLPALALALTIPDVYGRIEYPPKGPTQDGVHVFTEDGKQVTKPYMKYPSTLSHYQKWFNEYVHDYKWNVGQKCALTRPKTFDGYFCYLLRCKVLHESTHDIDPKGNHPVEFRLRVSRDSAMHPADGVGTTEEDSKLTYRITVDPVHLSQALANAALEYEKEITGAEETDKLKLLEKYRMDVDDLDEFSEFMEIYNPRNPRVSL